MLLLEPLLKNTRTFLRDELNNITRIDQSILITNDEKVPAYAGEEFINLYGATSTNVYPLEHIAREEIYAFNIGITRRLTGIPPDVTGESLIVENLISRAKSSMLMRAYEIINLIDGNPGIPALLIQDNDLDGYEFCVLTPLGFAGSSEIEEVYGEHFRVEDDSDRPAALFLELSFGGMQVYTNK